MKNGLTIGTLCLLLIGTSAGAEDYIDLVKKGNEAFQQNDFNTALELYHSAETELPESTELQYNMAGALYKEGKYEEAVDLYTKSLNTTDAALGASAHYNLGNTHFRMGDFQNAIKSYENSLSINPEDREAKYNLELARKRLKEQIKPEQQNQDQQNQQQKEQEEQEKKEQEKKEQEQEEQQDQEKEQQQQQQQQQGEQDKEQQEQEQKQPQDAQQEKKEMSREDAERILNGLKDEQDIQKKMKRARTSGNYSGKDW
ncbi:MAG: tetratricopeptide repeat protein [bacterium]|nr:tetratricopeptide repeat protein [bacterium]